MSRLSSMSAGALKAIFAPETDDDLIMLVTFSGINNGQDVRIADGFTGRLSETADDVVYGVTSNSLDYIFLPINVTLPSEEEASAPKCSITIHDVTRYLTPIIRNISTPPSVTLQLVLRSTPNVVEASFTGFYLTAVTYNAETVQLDLSMISYQNEPFPCFRFVPRYFPGLF